MYKLDILRKTVMPVRREGPQYRSHSITSKDPGGRNFWGPKRNSSKSNNDSEDQSAGKVKNNYPSMQLADQKQNQQVCKKAEDESVVFAKLI